MTNSENVIHEKFTLAAVQSKWQVFDSRRAEQETNKWLRQNGLITGLSVSAHVTLHMYTLACGLLKQLNNPKGNQTSLLPNSCWHCENCWLRRMTELLSFWFFQLNCKVTLMEIRWKSANTFRALLVQESVLHLLPEQRKLLRARQKFPLWYCLDVLRSRQI